jgi:acetolactate synthase regulatory subunit
MLTFVEFLEELSQDHVTLSPAEMLRMTERFGSKVLQMGHLQEDGSLNIPVDCIVEATQSLGSQTLTEAVETLKNSPVISTLQSAEALVDRVGDAQKRKLQRLVEEFQAEPNAVAAHRHWKQIEKAIFGVEYPD